MRKKAENQQVLTEPQHALRMYLDALLCEVAFPELEDSANAEVAAPAVNEEQAVAERAAAPVAEAPLPVVIKTVPPEAVVEPLAEPEPAPASENPPDAVAETAAPGPETAEKPAAEVVIPEWGQTKFQCLSFQVAGITLATPLEKLNGIVEVTEPLTELPGYAPWMLGLLSNRGRNVQVVDIAQVVMPEGREVDPGTARERLKYVILVDDGRFGLAAEGLSDVLSLSSEQVRWRGVHGKRPWLSGTVIDRMCAILDVDRLCAQLEEGLEAAE